jgi:hypothetical protein
VLASVKCNASAVFVLSMSFLANWYLLGGVHTVIFAMTARCLNSCCAVQFWQGC